MLALIRLWLLIAVSSLLKLSETRYFQYHTKYSTNHGDHTCMHLYLHVFSGREHTLIPYCIRTPGVPEVESDLLCNGNNATFAELKQSNITAEQLMKWFAPIDLISDYQYFLVSGSGEKEFFCNCSNTDHSFGTMCQYQFAVNTPSFNALVEATFGGKKANRDIRNLTEENDVTCYLLLNCTTYTGFCLDWRQVCDSRHDCVNGRDEEGCLEKELFNCDEKMEYRCRSGHCIPRTFAFDLTTDCPDWDDEQSSFLPEAGNGCATSMFAECEEHACGISRFSCGDGECIKDARSWYSYEGCTSRRNILLLKRVYDFHDGLSKECWLQMICQLGLSCLFEYPTVPNLSCQKNGGGTAQFCYTVNRTSAVCPKGNYIFFPTPSIAYPFVQLLYTKVPFQQNTNGILNALVPTRICYNTSACDIQPWGRVRPPIEEQGYHCYYPEAFDITHERLEQGGIIQATVALTVLQKVFSYCSYSLSSLDLYRCPNGLQISHHRLLDTFSDCYPSSDDENFKTPSCVYNLTNRLKCLAPFGGGYRCISKHFLHNGRHDCEDTRDELFPVRCTYEYDCQFFRDYDLSKSYPTMYEELCDGFELKWMGTNSAAKTADETDCDLWPCRTRFHRCDGVWNRENGCDELDCPGSLSSYLSQMVGNCSIDEHYCIHFNKSTLDCLSFTRAGDGVVDCLFAMDERRMPNISTPFGVLETISGITRQGNSGQCWNTTASSIVADKICNRKSDCPLNDDELLCSWHLNSSCSANQFTCKNGTCVSGTKRCNEKIDCWPEGEDEWACEVGKTRQAGVYRSFTLAGFYTEPMEEHMESLTLQKDSIQSKQEKIVVNDAYAIFYCHRGILFRSIDGNDACICPPSYYGNRCQFQRARLAITFRTEMPPIFDQNTIYHLVFLLLDQHRRVLTVERILHMPAKESLLKHFIHLLYPRNNVKQLNGNLFVRIEAYSITSTDVQSVSLVWLYQVQFPFLPVNRLALKLDLESKPLHKTVCHQLGCIHGRCASYVNIRDKHFCVCDQGWTGPTCNEQLIMDPCSPLKCDLSFSKCVVHGDHGICLCTLGRIGHNCRVPYNACNRVPCENGGYCLSFEERALQAVCMCPIDYFGEMCQFKTAKLTIHTPRTAEFIPVMIVHFLHTPANIPGFLSHRNTYFLKNIHPDTQTSVPDYQQRFLPSIIIVQTFVDLSSSYGSYYLLSLLSHNRTSLTKTLAIENRCVHVSERLNSTIMNFTWIKRVKLYHHYFKDVRCLFDEIYMCLVDRNQLMDCLIFNHEVAYCTDRNYCANGGRCLESKKAGQVQFACVCPECHYGSFCQLTMTQYSLTLDSILGQEIITDVSLGKQKAFVKITLALAVLMFLFGIVSNVCSSVTFSHIDIRSNGCGLYLFILSMASQCSLILFIFRFIYLLISQMSIISNQWLLSISCSLFDFLLQLSISFCDWLFVCVAFERTISVIKGIKFNKEFSIRMVKFVVPALLVSLTLTWIHQVFSRELIPDPRVDGRLWCVVKFSKAWLRTYDITMNLINSIVPFLLNLVSAVLLLISFSRTKQKTAKTSYVNVLKKQVKQHKDLIISPILMIICKLPMLIVILFIKCIKHKWQLYLSITCYFMALLPLTTTFAAFIMPSPSYLKISKRKRDQLFSGHYSRKNRSTGRG